jgi:hypothetical protein
VVFYIFLTRRKLYILVVARPHDSGHGPESVNRWRGQSVGNL